MGYELTGRIKAIMATVTYDSGFSKREFVVTAPDEKYPQDIKFEVVKEKCDGLNAYHEGQEVVVYFNLRGNEYNGRYFVNLSAWKIAPHGNTQAEPDNDRIDDVAGDTGTMMF